MKKMILAVLVFVFARSIQAIQWEVISQESKTPVHSGVSEVELSKSVGEHTIDILTQHGILFTGAASGILSILDTPMGDEAIVVESDVRMRVYGWCYTVDGKFPSVMPDKLFFPSQTSILRWFFAFAVYDNGKWIDCCTPAYLKPLR